MANVGGGAAYQQLGNVGNGISQGLQYWGNIQSEQNKEARARKEREQVRSKAEEAEFMKNFDYNEKEMSAVLTGQKDFDSVSRTFGQNFLNTALDLKTQARELRQKGDFRGAEEALNKMKKAQATMRNWNNYVGKVQPFLADYMESQANGTINPADDRSMVLDAIVKNKYIPSIGEDGNMILGVVMDNDTDGNQTTPKYRMIDPYALIDGGFKVSKKFDIAKTAQEMQKFFGATTTSGVKGDYIETIKGWDKNKDAELAAVIGSNILSSPDKMSYALYEATGGKVKKMSGFTDEDNKKVTDWMSGLVKGFTPTETKIEVRGQTASEKKAESDKRIGLGYAELGERARHNRNIEAQGWADITLNRSKAQQEKDLPNVVISPEKTVTVNNTPLRFRTYNLRDKAGKPESFTLGTKTDNTGKQVENIVTSVSFDTSGEFVRFVDGEKKEGNKYVPNIKIISKNSNNPENVAIYNTLLNQLYGRSASESSGQGYGIQPQKEKLSW